MSANPIDQSTFPPFSGQDNPTPCVKCTHVGADTYWAPQVLDLCTNGQLQSKENYLGPDHPGFIVRMCNNCTYTWGEQIAESADPVPMNLAATAGDKPKKSQTIKVRQLPRPTMDGPLYVVEN